MKENKDTIVVTFPIGVRSAEVKNGLLLTPLISQIIANKTDAEFMLVLNSMDSYVKQREQYVQPFMDACKKMNITPDEVFIDSYNKDKLVKHVNELIDLGIVREERRKIKICDCGKVQFLEDAKTQPEARLYKLDKDSTESCTMCHTSLKTIERDVLVFHAPKNLGEQPQSFPPNSVSRVNYLWKQIENMEYLFSRERETGVQIERNGKKYNIDIDSCWLQYLSSIEQKNIIMVASNHVVWHQCLATAYLRAKNDKRNVQMVFTPYIRGDEPLNSKSFISMRKALWFVSHMTWQRLETKWNPVISNILEKAPEDSITQTYLDIMKKELYNTNIKNILQNINNNNIMALIKKNKGKKHD